MEQKHAIYFHFEVPAFYFPNRNQLKQFIQRLIKKEGHKPGTINYIFCSDEALLEINKAYLNHDFYTDIVTFGLSQRGEAISSDIFISIDRVKDNAVSFGSTFSRELHRVIFHGILHLCGYKDKSQKDSRLMRAKEEEWLNKYFVPRGTRLNLRDR